MTRYELLHYPGNVEKSLTPGDIHGTDEIGRPYAVIDAEYKPQKDWTVVHLTYATPEQAQAHIARYQKDASEAGAKAAEHRAFITLFRSPR